MAPAGSPPTTGGDTHRIDKAVIIALAENHGLTLVDESDVLANPDDDGTVQVFDPAVRRKTDRFLLKFAK
jgi:predicted methyltransferase